MTVTRIFDFIFFQNQNYPQAKAFCQYDNGELKIFSTQDIIHFANKLSQALLNQGITKGDTIGVAIHANCAEFLIWILPLPKSASSSFLFMRPHHKESFSISFPKVKLDFAL